MSVGHQFIRLGQLRWLTWLFVGAGSVACLADVVPFLGFLSRVTRPESLGSVFWIWLVALAISQAIFNRHLSAPARLALACLTVLVLFRGLVLAYSWVSGWLPPLVALGVVLFFRLPRLCMSLAFLAVPVSLFQASTIWTSFMANESYSYLTRLEAWKVLWQIIEKNPLLGLGPANYYHYTPLYSILGWHVTFTSHNNYIDLIAQVGLIGILAFFWLIFEVSRMTVRLGSKMPFGFAKGYMIGVTGGLAATLVSGMLADWIIPFVYNVGIRGFRSSLLFWVFLGGALALKRMIANLEISGIPSMRQAIP
ncbi:MAG: O-antigen ligase family protein [Acidobacteriota bacterium]